MNNFEQWWEAFYANNGMPGVFNQAMREIALKAWNAAIDDAAQIAEDEANSDVAQSISSLTAI